MQVRLARRIGLTGGIGSGKSTVVAMLAEWGAAVVDADAISRGMTAPGAAAIAPIRREFGGHYITPEGALDRDAMRELVFGDPAARQRLEAIIHPLVSAQAERESVLAEQGQARFIVFDIPLLVESGRWRAQLNRILVVDCTPALQIQRVMTRNGWTRQAVQKIVDGQASRAQRLAAADICIYNETQSLGELKALVRQVALRFGL